MVESEDNKKKEAAKKRASLKQAVKDISSAGGLTVFLITTLTSFSLPGVLTTVLEGSFSLESEGVGLLFETIRLTAPLTLGIVLIALAIVREWVVDAYSMFFLSSIVLVLTTLALRSDGQSMVMDAWNNMSGNPFVSFPKNLLIQYFELYFWKPFVSSFLVGGFLTWALNRLMKVKTIDLL